MIYSAQHRKLALSSDKLESFALLAIVSRNDASALLGDAAPLAAMSQTYYVYQFD